MRKRMIGEGLAEVSAPDEAWLEVVTIAEAELSSEQAGYPIESALVPGASPGWRAATPGAQVVRLLFEPPVGLRRIRLVFSETELERTQEFVLRWSGDGGGSYRDVVRQQYHFSPPGTPREEEDYRVELQGVSVLELRIVPEIGGGPAYASLEQLRLA